VLFLFSRSLSSVSTLLDATHWRTISLASDPSPVFAATREEASPFWCPYLPFTCKSAVVSVPDGRCTRDSLYPPPMTGPAMRVSILAPPHRDAEKRVFFGFVRGSIGRPLRPNWVASWFASKKYGLTMRSYVVFSEFPLGHFFSSSAREVVVNPPVLVEGRISPSVGLAPVPPPPNPPPLACRLL